MKAEELIDEIESIVYEERGQKRLDAGRVLIERLKPELARLAKAEEALHEIGFLLPGSGMIRVSDLDKITKIIRAYKEVA